MRHSLLLLLLPVLLALASCQSRNQAPDYDYPYMTAHRGCWFNGLVPENSIEGIRMARRFHYPAIECDVKYTLDSVMVIMHDASVNRTMRLREDYSEIPQKVLVAGTSFKDLRQRYVLASADPALRQPIPTLEEFLTACRENGITPMLHSEIFESYQMAEQIMQGDWICFSANYEAVRSSRAFFGGLVLWDPGTSTPDVTVSKLDSIGLPAGMSTMKYDLLDKAYLDEVLRAGYGAQSSIWPTPNEARAIHDGATIILSDWAWFPTPDLQPSGLRVEPSRTLEAGQTIRLEFEKEAFSAMVLDLTFQGALEVVVNQERTYPFRHESKDTEHIGLRMYQTEPSILIRALEKTTLCSAWARFYVL